MLRDFVLKSLPRRYQLTLPLSRGRLSSLSGIVRMRLQGGLHQRYELLIDKQDLLRVSINPILMVCSCSIRWDRHGLNYRGNCRCNPKTSGYQQTPRGCEPLCDQIAQTGTVLTMSVFAGKPAALNVLNVRSGVTPSGP